MTLAARVDEFGRAGWIAATVLAFIVWWPLGLLTLGFVLATRRFGGCGWHGAGRWYNTGEGHGRWNAAGPGGGGFGCGWGGRGGRGFRPSGNSAFDDYRAETLRRLEEEQREFAEYLERLRRAKDKSEFEQFMAERRTRPESPEQGGTV